MPDEKNSSMQRVIRVLIADDQRPARQALSALLSLLPQIQVIAEVASGQEAIAQIITNRPDIVLMDAQMPDMDGLEATRRIKQEWPDIRVIILTMYARYYRAALRAGADAFLLKGTPADQLVQTIVELSTSR